MTKTIKMMTYAIDQGNTTIKFGVFRDGELVEDSTWAERGEFLHYFEGLAPSDTIISSVSGNAQSLSAILGHGKQKVLHLNKETALPIMNRYRSPETLGMDRIAAVCGAHSLFPEDNCLVVDFGTCITYDLIDKSGAYWGGAISPGLNMRFKAMNAFTGSLPLVNEWPEELPDIGQTTVESMINGTFLGIVGELEKFISFYKERYTDLKVLFCGGDYQRFETRLKESIFAAPNLVLIGLNSILKHNDEEVV